MPAQIDISVPNPRLLRTAYTQIKVYRGPVRTGPFVEATTASTRIQIGDETSYTFFDAAGSETSYYRISYYNERTRAESEQGEAVQGQTDPAFDVLSIQELRDHYLFGINLTDPETGAPYPQSFFRWYIQAAVSRVERELEIPLREETIVGEVHDYIFQEFRSFQAINLHRKPVIAVDAVRLTFPTQPQATRTYPAEWIQVKPESGVVEIVPGAGAFALPLSGTGGLLYPTLFGGGLRYLPHIHEVDYRAGFRRGAVPADIRHLVGLYASLGPLNVAGDLVAGAGLQAYSIGVDGLSQSVTTTNSSTNAGFGARIIQYLREAKEIKQILRATYRGIPAFAS